MGSARVRWRLLGDVGAVVDGATAPIRTQRSREILALLVLHARRRVSTERLIDDLWGERPPRTARNSVQRFVADLRRDLGAAGERIVTVDGGYRLDVPDGDEIDAELASAHVARAQRYLDERRTEDALDVLEAGLAQWTSEPLGGLGDAPFVEPQRARLEEIAVGGLDLRIECELALGQHAALVGELRTLVERHPYRERLCAHLMTALYATGRQQEALAEYRKLRALLVADLGVEPSPPLRELERRILEHDETLLSPLEERQAQPAAARAVGSVASPRTTAFGRHAELALIGRLLEQDARTITLVGPGGSGKTRLASMVIERFGPRFGDGVVVAELDGIADPDRVDAVLATACGIDLSGAGGEAPLSAVVEHLAHKDQLLVIDNAEQVARGVARAVATVCQGAPGARVLTTSRVVLDLADEDVVTVGGLALTASEGEETSAAAAMFADRAGRLAKQVELDDNVAQICALVDGLPLALELIARWVAVMTPEQIIDRLVSVPLADSGLLTTGATDVPARQRDLSTVLDQSWTALSDSHQSIMVSLSACRGGFDMPAAAELAAATPLQMLELVNRSLITRRPGGRFEIHELIRQHAAAHLDQSERAGVAARHADHYLQRLAAAATELRGTDAAAVIQAADDDVDNLVAAWNWAVERGDVDRLLRSAGGLAELLPACGRVADAADLLAKAAVIGPPWFRATMLAHRLSAGWSYLGVDEIEDDYARGVALVATDDPAAQRASVRLGDAYAKFLNERVGKTDEALDIVRGLVATAEQLDAPELVAALQLTGAMAEKALGHFAAAGDLLEAASAYFEAVGDLRGASDAQGLLAAACAEQYLIWEALEADRRALDLRTRRGDVPAMLIAEANTGASYVLVGAWEQARAHTARAIELAGRLGDADFVPYLDCQLAEVEAGAGRPEDAERLFSSGIGQLRASGYSLGLRLKLPEWGRFLVERERWLEAELVLDEALGVWQAIGGVHFVVTVDATRARARLGGGDAAGASDLAHDAWRRIDETEGRLLPYPIEAMVDCWMVFHALGEHAAADAVNDLAQATVRRVAASIAEPTYRRTFLALRDVALVVGSTPELNASS